MNILNNPSLKVFKNKEFTQFYFVRILISLGLQIQSVAIAWNAYEIARLSKSINESALVLGFIGLLQFLPIFILSPISGTLIDKFNRKKILILCIILELILSILLISSTRSDKETAMLLIYIVAIGLGIIRAFFGPAMNAIAPSLVSKEELPQSIALNSLAYQMATMVGPAIGGIIYGFGTAIVYSTAFSLVFIAFILVLIIKVPKQNMAKRDGNSFELIKEGFRYVFSNKIIIGAISLDLAVVLLAGATALLPVFAKDILHAGPIALGILRSSMAIGAATIAFYLSINPINKNVGKWMFGAVILFGLSIIGFGLSKSVPISVACLIIAGAADEVSVYVRSSLIQLATPDEMRGRVSAVSMVFISASNELGEFQSGIAARILGPVNAVLFGGISAILIAMGWMKLYKPLSNADKFEDAIPK